MYSKRFADFHTTTILKTFPIVSATVNTALSDIRKERTRSYGWVTVFFLAKAMTIALIAMKNGKNAIVDNSGVTAYVQHCHVMLKVALFSAQSKAVIAYFTVVSVCWPGIVVS